MIIAIIVLLSLTTINTFLIMIFVGAIYQNTKLELHDIKELTYAMVGKCVLKGKEVEHG